MRLLWGLLLGAVLSHAALAADSIVPDPVLTPGEWHNPPTQLGVLCQSGYTDTVRNVPNSVKNEVFRAYGYDPRSIVRGHYEIDHSVPLALDGTNSKKNLWPQSYRTQASAYKKDVLERTLYRLVCKGKLDLLVAQRAIASDWQAAYQTYVLHKRGRF